MTDADVEGMQEQKGDRDFLTGTRRYIKCIENEGKTCDAPMLQHSLSHHKVYLRIYLKENHAKFGKMIQKLVLPPSSTFVSFSTSSTLIISPLVRVDELNFKSRSQYDAKFHTALCLC